MMMEITFFVFIQQNYTVSSTWYQRHAAMTPLFLDTQASQSFSQVEAMETGHVMRATQDVAQFTPTQTEGQSPFLFKEKYGKEST